ncbi:MAG TPA: zf-HC2 domain-containing protein [Kofleriaceae bacterium]
MTMCEKIRPQLTAYLDGELADDPGSVVRGHLRECAACRQIARDEAALRDALRMLAPVDPPASLWAGVRGQLAAAEVADARKPRWRRHAARWGRWARSMRWVPTMRQLATASLVAAAAIAVFTWRGQVGNPPPDRIAQPQPEPQRPPPPQHALPAPAIVPSPPSADDVTADLIAEPARTTATYARAIEELMTVAEETRARWSDGDKAAFDAHIAGLRDAITRAGPPRAVQRAQRSLIRYLQGAVVRDDVMLASGGTR